jgi:hypothetical protein
LSPMPERWLRRMIVCLTTYEWPERGNLSGYHC